MCAICVHIAAMSRAASPTNQPTRTKEDRLVARITRADKELIERGAAVAGQSAEESRRLVDALLAPGQAPTAAMKKSLKRYREAVISEVNPESPIYRQSGAW
jgi:uncharacterized protein (DUF1778 family)